MNQVFNVMDQLAGDTEPSVRAELMEQVDGLALFVLIFHLTMSGSPHSYVLPRTPKQRRRHGKKEMGRILSNSDMTFNDAGSLISTAPGCQVSHGHQ